MFSKNKNTQKSEKYTEIEKNVNEILKFAKEMSQQLRDYLQENQSKVNISNDQHMFLYNKITQVSNDVNESGYKGPDYEQTLLEFYEQLITEYLKYDVEKALQVISKEEFLLFVYDQYTKFAIYVHRLYLTFDFLNSFKLAGVNKDLVTVGFKLYKSIYWDKVEKDRLYKEIVYFQFEQLRQDCIIPKAAVKTIIDMYAKIGFTKDKNGIITKKDNSQGGKIIIENDFEDCKRYYVQKFEQQFKQTLWDYYNQRIDTWSKLTSVDYIQEVNKILEKEIGYAKEYYQNSEEVIMVELERILISTQAQKVAENNNSGIFYMLQNRQDQYIKQCFQLFNRTPMVRSQSLKYLIDQMYSFLLSRGEDFKQEIQRESSKPKEDKEKKSSKDLALLYINNVQELLQYTDQLIENVFKNDTDIIKCRDKGFQSILNSFDKTPYYLAIFSDEFLKNTKIYTDQQLEQQIQGILKVFLYLYSRDEFFQKYQKFFANRLLNASGLNDDTEKQMIAIFKSEAGNVVNNLEKMYKDLKLSEDFTADSGKLIEQIGGFSFDVKILNLNWGINIQYEVQPPKAMLGVCEKLLQIYKKKHPAHNSEILYNQGTADIQLKGKDKNYNLSCTTIQMIILLHLEEQPEFCASFGDLQKKTGIEKKEFDFNLFFLVKNKVITRENKDMKKKIQETEKVSLDKQFSNKSRVLKVMPKGRLKEEDDDGKQAENWSLEQRKIQMQRESVIDATIVKIMKSQRTLDHNVLETDVIKLIKLFQPDPKMIKKQINSLIDREYIKRSPNQRTKYEYVP